MRKSYLWIMVFTFSFSGCASSRATLGNRIWQAQDSQPITAETLLIVDVGQEIFSSEEIKTLLARRQKRMEDASKPPERPPLNLDARQQAEENKRKDALFDYIELNEHHLSTLLVQRLNNNGISVISAEDEAAKSQAFSQKPKLVLKVSLSEAESGKKETQYITAGFGSHKLETEVSLEDLRQFPARECLKFEVSAGGMRPNITIAPKWNPLHQDTAELHVPDAEKVAQEIVPVVVEYFVKQNWLEPSFAPDYPKNQEKKKSFSERLKQKIFFWRD